jgi:hypothetical protein
LERERREDLKRIVEIEALLLLLMRKRIKTALEGDAKAAKKAALLFLAVQASVLQASERAVDLSLRRTLAQVEAATGVAPRVPRVRVTRALAQQNATAAASEAHAVTSRYLESQLPDGRLFLPEIERRAAWEADRAFNEARRKVIDNLPEKVKAVLFLRWDTAGDKRVCDRCDKRDGDIVQASEGFHPPAPLHGMCRCSETILHKDEI